MAYPDREQLPKGGYTLQAVPLRSLAAAGTGSGALGIVYREAEQLPRRGYTLGGIPLRALARAYVQTGLGIIYPDREQAAKRAYALGALPLLALARAVAYTPPSTGGGGGTGSWSEPGRHYNDDEEVLAITAYILTHYYGQITPRLPQES